MEISQYQLGPFVFEITNHGIPVPKNLEKFRTSGAVTSCRFELAQSDRLSRDRTDFQVQQDRVSIHMDGDLETRYLYIPGADHPYAISRELDASHVYITVDRRDLELFDYDNVFCSILSLERRLAKYQAFVLHSARISYRGQAILFTGPSGIGKSTQANLWNSFRGASVINGDRNLLRFRDNTLYAYGWPICGSSGICHNKAEPVRAIVLLEQSQTNCTDHISAKDITLRLMRELTINYYNCRFWDDAAAFLTELTNRCEIWRLRCDISQEAVVCLEKALYGTGNRAGEMPAQKGSI